MMVIVAAVAWVHDSAAQCPATYSIDLIQPVSCGFFYPSIGASGISETGEICGGGGGCGDTDGGALVWYGAPPIIYLPRPPGWYVNSTSDINSSRQIIGNMAFGAPDATRVAFLFQNGSYINLGLLRGDMYAEPTALNESGAVCGTSTGGGWRAFFWKDGQMSALNLPLGPDSMANGISEDEHVCGWMGYSEWTCHAFIWSKNEVIDLGTILPKAGGAIATSINGHKNVCGRSLYGDPFTQLRRRGFIWQDRMSYDLGLLPGLLDCFPNDLNDSNIVVGSCANEFAGSKAFVWQNGVMRALNDLIPPQLHLNLRNASAINNAGQIAAFGTITGGPFVAVRLTPIPPVVGDCTCDWRVNVPDLIGVIQAWGPCPAFGASGPNGWTCNADFNGDGVVDKEDILAVVLNWTG